MNKKIFVKVSLLSPVLLQKKRLVKVDKQRLCKGRKCRFWQTATFQRSMTHFPTELNEPETEQTGRTERTEGRVEFCLTFNPKKKSSLSQTLFPCKWGKDKQKLIWRQEAAASQIRKRLFLPKWQNLAEKGREKFFFNWWLIFYYHSWLQHSGSKMINKYNYFLCLERLLSFINNVKSSRDSVFAVAFLKIIKQKICQLSIYFCIYRHYWNSSQRSIWNQIQNGRHLIYNF